MTDFSYTHLPGEEQLALLDQRLRDLEREHFQISLRQIAPNAAIDPQQERAAADMLAARIDKLRSMRESITSPQGGTQS